MSHRIYTEKPKSGRARKAWERFEQTKGHAPYSVSYSPCYQYEAKGWICEHYGPETLSPAYATAATHTFYPSQDL